MGIKDEVKKASLLSVYTKIRDESVASFCKLLKRHPHFNFRVNILHTVLPKIASHELYARKEVTTLNESRAYRFKAES